MKEEYSAANQLWNVRATEVQQLHPGGGFYLNIPYPKINV